MQPEQALYLLNDIFLPSLRNEHRVTSNVIRAIPLDQSDYRPDGISMSALALAWHTVITEMVFLDGVTAGGFDLARRPMPDSLKTSADLAQWYEAEFDQRAKKLPHLSGEQLSKVIDFRGLFQLPAVMFVNFLLSHSIHHRGQLSMYLRPMGAKVPSIYGESFDAAEARRLATQA